MHSVHHDRATQTHTRRPPQDFNGKFSGETSVRCPARDRIVQASAPSRTVDRGMAGAGLLAHVLLSKYAHLTPLYCLSQIYAPPPSLLGS